MHDIFMPFVKILRDNLRKSGWCITAFPFRYNNINYTVLFEDLDKTLERNKYYIARLTFIDDNENRRLDVLANTYNFNIHITELRSFFKVQYAENLGDFLQQFYTNFNRYIPKQFNKPSKQQQIHIVERLNRNDNDNAMYCYKVMRNGIIKDKQRHRSIFNDNKTRLLRPTLYQDFKNDDTISFCYSINPDDERTDTEIIERFSKNH